MPGPVCVCSSSCLCQHGRPRIQSSMGTDKQDICSRKDQLQRSRNPITDCFKDKRMATLFRLVFHFKPNVKTMNLIISICIMKTLFSTTHMFGICFAGARLIGADTGKFKYNPLSAEMDIDATAVMWNEGKQMNWISALR